MEEQIPIKNVVLDVIPFQQSHLHSTAWPFEASIKTRMPLGAHLLDVTMEMQLSYWRFGDQRTEWRRTSSKVMLVSDNKDVYDPVTKKPRAELKMSALSVTKLLTEIKNTWLAFAKEQNYTQVVYRIKMQQLKRRFQNELQTLDELRRGKQQQIDQVDLVLRAENLLDEYGRREHLIYPDNPFAVDAPRDSQNQHGGK